MYWIKKKITSTNNVFFRNCYYLTFNMICRICFWFSCTLAQCYFHCSHIYINIMYMLALRCARQVNMPGGQIFQYYGAVKSLYKLCIHVHRNIVNCETTRRFRTSTRQQNSWRPNGVWAPCQDKENEEPTPGLVLGGVQSYAEQWNVIFDVWIPTYS